MATVVREALPLAIHGGLVLLSPRVEFLVLSLLRGDRETGLVPRRAARVRVPERRSRRPSAPGRCRASRARRCAAAGGCASAPHGRSRFSRCPRAIGLGLVAPAVARLLLGGGYDSADYTATAGALRLLALALPALFMNGLLLSRARRRRRVAAGCRG